MPPKQQSSLCCLALLAMAKLTPNTPCRKASNDWIRILPHPQSFCHTPNLRGINGQELEGVEVAVAGAVAG